MASISLSIYGFDLFSYTLRELIKEEMMQHGGKYDPVPTFLKQQC